MSDHADRILAAIEAGNNVSALGASWRRCLTLHKLNPDAKLVPERDTRKWLEAQESNARLMSISRPYLEQLYHLLADKTCGIYLGAHDGMLLDVITNRPFDNWDRQPEDWLGTVYSEQNFGTNGIGTCLVEQRAVVLRGGQHFLSVYGKYTCISAPLFGPDAELIGVLSISEDADARDARLDSFLSITVAGMARRIEIEMFAAAFPKARLLLAAPARGNASALVAIDRDERVVGATHAARRLLALDPETLAAEPGFEALFAQPAHEGDALADGEQRMIERALARCGGNVSAAARIVGISRSTLYRKVALYEATRRG